MSADYAIDTEQLSKSYRTLLRRREILAVDGVSLRVARGSSFGLLGPNGAGKTTFVKMLLSVVRPTRGRARLFGLDARTPEARRPIGYLPEDHRFPAYFTGRAMLDFYAALSGAGRHVRRRLIPELLERVGLERWGDVRLSKYSKGMLRRLGLAQALVHSPSLLILDEPSDGVDPVGRIRIREILRSLEERGVTVFINSHLLAEVELFCREVAILNQGRIALAGAVKDLTAARGYRVAAAEVPAALALELQSGGGGAMPDGRRVFVFPTREAANAAIDRLRAARCLIESVEPAGSTLEEIFVRTVHG